MRYSFADVIEQFESEVQSIYTVFPILMQLVQTSTCLISKELSETEERHANQKQVGDDGTISFGFERAEQAAAFQKKILHFREFHTATHLLPRTMLISLVSAFDTFTGALARGIFHTKPDVLKGSEKSITFAELISFASFKEAREHIVEAEVQGLLRKSHAQQFGWLEKKLGIELRKDLRIWPEFIELTERRNLFVHCDGVISHQYFQICQEHGVNLQRGLKTGNRLDVDPAYFRKAFRTLMELGLKLGHVVWRKLVPDQACEADTELNDQCVALIQHEEYDLACQVLAFALQEFSRRTNEANKLYFQFNLAQAYKWMGKKRDCEQVLSSIPVATLSDKYQLAEAVLVDDFPRAVEIMHRMGKNGDVRAIEYYQWPIFKAFRKTETFAKTYHAVFGEPFRVQAGTPSSTKCSGLLSPSAGDEAKVGVFQTLPGGEDASEQARIIQQSAEGQEVAASLSTRKRRSRKRGS